MAGSLFSVYIGFEDLRLFQVLSVLILTLFWSIFAYRLRVLIQTPLEEKWITDGYDTKRLMDNVASRLLPVLDKASVCRIVREEIAHFMHIKGIYSFLVKEGDSGEALDPSITVLKSDDPLCRFLTWKMHVLKIQEVDSSLLEKLVEVKVNRKGLLLPFCSASGLEGFMIIGSKISEDPYTPQDLRVLQVILQQANCVFARIQPYDIIKRQYESERNWVNLLERDVSESQQELKTMHYWIAHDIKNDLTGLKLFIENTFGESIPDEDSRSQILRKLTALILQMKEILRPLKQEG